MTDPRDASIDETFVDRTWMAYSRTILLVLAMGFLLVRGAYLRDLPVWLCVGVAVPALCLTLVFIRRMRALSRGLLDTPRGNLMVMGVLVTAAALLGAMIAMMG